MGILEPSYWLHLWPAGRGGFIGGLRISGIVGRGGFISGIVGPGEFIWGSWNVASSLGDRWTR